MAEKIVIFVCILFLNQVYSDSVFEGSRLDGDRLIHKSEHVKIPYFIRSTDIAFPKYYEDNNNIITAINIIDNSKEGAMAEVDYGGVGFTYANIHLRSDFWHGFNFTVEIYGLKLG